MKTFFKETYSGEVDKILIKHYLYVMSGLI